MKYILTITALSLAALIASCQSAPSAPMDDHSRIVALAESGTPAVYLWISGFA